VVGPKRALTLAIRDLLLGRGVGGGCKNFSMGHYQGQVNFDRKKAGGKNNRGEFNNHLTGRGQGKINASEKISMIA